MDIVKMITVSHYHLLSILAPSFSFQIREFSLHMQNDPSIPQSTPSSRALYKGYFELTNLKSDLTSTWRFASFVATVFGSETKTQQIASCLPPVLLELLLLQALFLPVHVLVHPWLFAFLRSKLIVVRPKFCVRGREIMSKDRFPIAHSLSG